jgi:hypothetical protein
MQTSDKQQQTTNNKQISTEKEHKHEKCNDSTRHIGVPILRSED